MDAAQRNGARNYDASNFIIDRTLGGFVPLLRNVPAKASPRRFSPEALTGKDRTLERFGRIGQIALTVSRLGSFRETAND